MSIRLTKREQSAITRALASGDIEAETIDADDRKQPTTHTSIPIRCCAHCGGEVRTTPTGDSFVCDGAQWWHFDCRKQEAAT